jgi:hypothetical protein
VATGQGGGDAGEGVADDGVVSAGAEQDANGGGVPVEVAEVGVDPGDVEPELAGVFGLESAEFELDDEESGLDPVEEQQIDVEVVAVDGEVVLPPDEGEAVAELEQKLLHLVDQGGLKVAFGYGAGDVEEIQDVGVAGQLLREL